MASSSSSSSSSSSALFFGVQDFPGSRILQRFLENFGKFWRILENFGKKFAFSGN
jgi:hypothetical protein